MQPIFSSAKGLLSDQNITSVILTEKGFPPIWRGVTASATATTALLRTPRATVPWRAAPARRLIGVRRGVFEKRLRDRINISLYELKRLVYQAFENSGSAKLEKAEILQMTVDHLKVLHASKVYDMNGVLCKTGQPDTYKLASAYHVFGMWTQKYTCWGCNLRGQLMEATDCPAFNQYHYLPFR